MISGTCWEPRVSQQTHLSYTDARHSVWDRARYNICENTTFIPKGGCKGRLRSTQRLTAGLGSLLKVQGYLLLLCCICFEREDFSLKIFTTIILIEIKAQRQKRNVYFILKKPHCYQVLRKFHFRIWQFIKGLIFCPPFLPFFYFHSTQLKSCCFDKGQPMFISNGIVSLISWNTNFYHQGSPSWKHCLSPRNANVKIFCSSLLTVTSLLNFQQRLGFLPRNSSPSLLLGALAICQPSSLGQGGEHNSKQSGRLSQESETCVQPWKDGKQLWHFVPKTCPQRNGH